MLRGQQGIYRCSLPIIESGSDDDPLNTEIAMKHRALDTIPMREKLFLRE